MMPGDVRWYRAGMTELADRWDEWETTLRDPAEQAKEGVRRLDCGPAVASTRPRSSPMADGPSASLPHGVRVRDGRPVAGFPDARGGC
jgi:hypothetical protein